VADGAEPVGRAPAAVPVLPARFADPDLARAAERAAVHDPAQLRPAPAALPARIQRSGPEQNGAKFEFGQNFESQSLSNSDM
jgi:hypothetical protein